MLGVKRAYDHEKPPSITPLDHLQGDFHSSLNAPVPYGSNYEGHVGSTIVPHNNHTSIPGVIAPQLAPSIGAQQTVFDSYPPMLVGDGAWFGSQATNMMGSRPAFPVQQYLGQLQPSDSSLFDASIPVVAGSGWSPQDNSMFNMDYIDVNIMQQSLDGPVPGISCTFQPCNMVFTRVSDRIRHEYTVHFKLLGLHLCPIAGCSKSHGKGYSRSDKVTEHLWKKHGNLGYMKAPGPRIVAENDDGEEVQG